MGLFLSTFFSKIDKLLDGIEERLKGIGILLPGYLKEDRSVPYLMVNIPFLEDIRLKELVHSRYGVDIVLDIDRNGTCLAEFRFGKYLSFRRLMYVTIGTGVGVGLLIDGKICRITNDSIGELGHLTLVLDGAECVCGNRGCVEAYVSKSGLKRIARKIGIYSYFPQESEININHEIDHDTLFIAAEKGNENARLIFEEFEHYLVADLVIYANIYSPDIIILGGGITAASEYFLTATQKILDTQWFERKNKRILVKRTQFGLDAGIIGAAALFL